MIAERRWVVLQHVPFEGPGAIAQVAMRRGLQMDVWRMYESAPVPAIAELEGLVVMGGPMGISETVQYPRLIEETRLIASAVHAQIPVLGVCLGAQLMAHALEAHVYRGEHEEIGSGTVCLTADGRSDPVLGVGEKDILPVVHWHAETFDLPNQAVLLASSESYPHQAFRVGQRAYALQFHIELNAELLSSWRAHLPTGVEISSASQTEVETTGWPIIDAFFEQANRQNA